MAVSKYTRQEVEVLNQRHNACVIIDNVVYDVSEFLDDHPGGVDVLLKSAGKDASQGFFDVGHSDIALDWREKFVVGEVVDEERRPVLQREPSPPVPQVELLKSGTLLLVWGVPLTLAALASLVYLYLFE